VNDDSASEKLDGETKLKLSEQVPQSRAENDAGGTISPIMPHNLPVYQINFSQVTIAPASN
jgi:hypothetical protein